MKIGIAAATPFEIEPAVQFLRKHKLSLDHDIQIVITGIGLVATTYQLIKFISQNRPGLMIQAGIAGSFNHNLNLGQTMLVGDEVIADLGVEENNSFQDLFDMGFMLPGTGPYTERRLMNPAIADWKSSALPVVHASSVNEISTDQTRIELVKEKYQVEVESMEGAAFHYVCLQEKLNFIQLRAASNYVGERDKTKWKLKESIANLNGELIKLVQNIPT